MRVCRPFVLILCAAVCILKAAGHPLRQAAANPPRQPFPFSHKMHAGDLKVQCKECHPNPDPGEMMRITSPSTCIRCHSALNTETPAMRQLAQGGREVRWVRVYEIPSYVRFSHRTHAESRNTCTECHGPVTERNQLYREGDITMGGCMNCHREKKASNDCAYCHEPM